MTSAMFSLDPGLRVFAHDLGLSWARVTRRAELPGDLLSGGPVQLRTADYYRLWSALQDEAGDRDLTVEIGEAVSPESFSPPILAALCSPTLRVAATRIAAYKPLVGPMSVVVHEGPDELRVTQHWPEPAPPTLLGISELVFWVALARLGTRAHVRPVQVTAPDRQLDRDALEGYLGAPVRRGTTYEVRFRNTDADRPFLTENDAMWTIFSTELGRRLADLQAGASTADRVQAALHETLPAGDSSLTGITRKLTVSARTLQRQLHGEGTSYQAVLSRTREDLARHYLSTTALRTGEIAYLLGYDDTSSFHRAFRSWTGTSPELLRRSPDRPTAG